MTEYNAIGEIEIAPTTKRIVKWLDALEGYSAAVSRADRGITEIPSTRRHSRRPPPPPLRSCARRPASSAHSRS
jgi:hypothetical protein